LRTGSGAIMHAAIGCESPPMTGSGFFPVSRPGEEARIELRGIGRHVILLQRLFDAVVPSADLAELARLQGSRLLRAKG